MEAGGTDGDGWEGHVGHWEGRLLQGGHHLDVANVINLGRNDYCFFWKIIKQK